MTEKEKFTRYEIARILGARALQVSMDAPLLIKLSKEELEKMNYDSLKIAEKEFDSGVLPISVKRPLPAMKGAKLESIKEEKIDDEKIIAKEKEIEEEITKKAVEEGFVEEDEENMDEDFGSSDEEN